jgi:hypothetical protein
MIKKFKEKFKDFNGKWNTNCKNDKNHDELNFKYEIELYWKNFNASYN